MAEVKNSDMPDVFKFMTEVWGFMKKFWIPENEDSYWRAVTEEAEGLLQNYENDFCQGYVFFVLDYLEWKQQKSSQKSNQGFVEWLYARYAQRARKNIEQK